MWGEEVPEGWRWGGLGLAEEGHSLAQTQGKGFHLPPAGELGTTAADRLCQYIRVATGYGRAPGDLVVLCSKQPLVQALPFTECDRDSAL